MVSEYGRLCSVKYLELVLILVVVEDGLRAYYLYAQNRLVAVLILVVVEDGLRDATPWKYCIPYNVLILVVVEDGLREEIHSQDVEEYHSLNPCCCGRWSQSLSDLAERQMKMRVLILVVVEDGLRVCTAGNDYTHTGARLNPCCCGRWSQS